MSGNINTHSRNIRGVRRRTDRPVIHFEGLSRFLVFLRLPQHIQQDIHRGLGVVAFWLRVTVQHRHAQRSRPGVFLQDSLTVKFGLAVDVRGFGRRGDSVRRFALHAREYVVCGDVD